MEFCLPVRWDPMGVTGLGGASFVRLEELVWEALLGCVEFSSFVFDGNATSVPLRIWSI